MYTYAETRGAADAPLVFTFHGTGGDEQQFHGLASQILPEARVISPRGDVSEMGMNRFFRRTGEGVYDMADLDQRTETMAGFIRSFGAASRVIGFGYSNGANILAAVAFKHPDLFTDLALLHPLIPWQPAPQPKLAKTRVLITAGQRDPICPAQQTEALIGWFKTQGTMPQVLWHPGGHELVQDEVQALASFLS